ncbi:MAG: hypothetical protein RML46_11920, partial [Anaerolineae bacterium]|nr:hypothetical protein [Anaerolineae bacterium]
PRVIAIKWFFSVLDVIAVAVLYRAVRIVFGYHPAVLSALLYATNPWVVEFIRWIWYQALTTAWATLAFSFLLLAITRNQRRGLYLALGLISAMLMGTVHIAALPWAGVLYLVGLMVAWRTRSWRGLVSGVVGGGLVLLPYFLFTLRAVPSNGWHAVKMGMQGSNWNLAVFPLTLELVSGRGARWMLENPQWEDALVRLPWGMNWTDGLLGIALLVGILGLVGWKERRSALLWVLGWTLGAPLLYLRSDVYLIGFYLLYVLPAPFVLIGLLASLVEGFPRPMPRMVGRMIGGLLTVAILLISLVWAHTWSVRIRLEQEGRMGPPTRAWLLDMTAEKLRKFLEQRPDCTVIILSSFVGDGSAFDWIRTALRTDRIRVVQTGHGLIIAPRCTCYLMAPDSSEADLSPIWDRLIEEPGMRIPASPPWRFYCLADRGNLPNPLAEWENGLSLIGVHLDGEPRPDGRVIVAYTWHYREVAPHSYHFFNHLFQGEATLVAQMDGPGVPPQYWRDDDVLVTRFELGLPHSVGPGTYRLLMGVYRWPDLQRVLMKDGTDIYEVHRWTVGQ